MVSVTTREITKHFGDVVAVDRVSLAIRRGELFFLLGPSGCGKTTLLRMVAGLYEIDRGQLLFDDRAMNSVPAHKRNVGMVFQNYALWPHMTVAQNVSYGLEARGVPAARRRKRVRHALEMVRMADYTKRRPNELSGGQQQRVALARALVVEPDLVLLDEPLSNLDAKLRLEMRQELRRIHRETGITTIYVTHDQKEALSLAERLAVMRDGRVEQIGTAREVYQAPANSFVASFIGQTNMLAGRVGEKSADGMLTVSTAFGDILVGCPALPAAGTEVICSVRPEVVRLGKGARNRLQGRIMDATYLGDSEEILFSLIPPAEPASASAETATALSRRRMARRFGNSFRATTLPAGSRHQSRGDVVTLSFAPDDVVLL